MPHDSIFLLYYLGIILISVYTHNGDTLMRYKRFFYYIRYAIDYLLDSSPSCTRLGSIWSFRRRLRGRWKIKFILLITFCQRCPYAAHLYRTFCIGNTRPFQLIRTRWMMTSSLCLFSLCESYPTSQIYSFKHIHLLYGISDE